MQSDSINQSHWYILSYLGNHRDAVKRLNLVKIPSFAPTFFGQESNNSNKQDFLLFANYAFVYATQNQIYDLKRKELHTFNFLPKNFGKEQVHPYVEEYVIEQLRKIEEINGGKIPFMPYPTDVLDGDTIMILEGQFKGLKATAIKKNGSKYRQIVLDVAEKFIIPLGKLKAGEFEIVNYRNSRNNTKNTKIKKEDVIFLQEALGRYYGVFNREEDINSNDKRHVKQILERYKAITPGTHTQRVKLALLLVMANTIQEDEKEKTHYIKYTTELIQENCSTDLRANAYCTLYGCTFNEVYSYKFNATITKKEKGKEEKVISKYDELMNQYKQWNITLYHRKKKQELICNNPCTLWFALEISSLTESIKQILEEKNIQTYDPHIKTQAGKNVLLAHSTFNTLSSLQNPTLHFTFFKIREADQVMPLYFSDRDIEDYQYIINSGIDDLEVIDLTTEIEDILSRTRKISFPVNARFINGIIYTVTNKGKKENRFVFYLPHLIALSIPYKPEVQNIPQ